MSSGSSGAVESLELGQPGLGCFLQQRRLLEGVLASVGPTKAQHPDQLGKREALNQ